MSYREGGYRSPFVGVGVVIGILVAIVVTVRGLAIFGNLTGIGAPTNQSVEKTLFANANTGEMYRVYKRTYPQDYDKMVADIVRHMKAGESRRQLDAVIAAYMLTSMKLHRKDAVQAPASEFATYRHAEIDVVEMLRNTNPQMCATYIVDGQVDTSELGGFQTPQIAFRIATLEAGAAGRDHPIHRSLAPPKPDDIRLLGRQMVANGTSESGVTAFFNGALKRLPPLEQCLTGLAFYRALDQLPAGKGDQIYAFLLSRSS